MANQATTNAADETTVKRSVYLLRVSTKRQMDTGLDIDPEGNSIPTQRQYCDSKNRELGALKIDEYIEPGYSGQLLSKRPIFKDLLKRIVEQRDVDYVIIYMRSRIFRNYIEAAIVKQQLAALGVKLISAKENFGDGYMGEAMEAITDVFNWMEVRRNGEDISAKMANKAKNGGTITKAKMGYLNTTANIEGRKVNTIAVDKDRAPGVLMAFELFATGDYSLRRLRTKLTEAGFRSRPTPKQPTGQPLGIESLRKMLQDRYYVGWVTHKGIEYKGRHETFVPQELFDRVQRVLASHQGAGTRERKHHHYLKGWLWCGRCGRRFVLQRATGRHGGEYYYFFCVGRQDKSCGQPFIPVEAIEDAIVRHYRATVDFPADFRAGIRGMIDDAKSEGAGLTTTLREQYAARLKKLDEKEDYFLDLGAEEGWPKEKLRAKINSIRRERDDIRASLKESEQRLSTGAGLLYKALELLEEPASLYERGDEVVRTLLNRAIFTKFMIDGRKVVGHELREPFDALDETYQRQQRRSYRRAVGRADGDESAVAAPLPHQRGQRRIARRPNLPKEAGARMTLTDLLDRALQARGSSKPVMVELQGLEPWTSSMPWKRSSQLSYSPKKFHRNFL